MGACVRKITAKGQFNSGPFCNSSDAVICERDAVAYSCLDTDSASECHDYDGVTIERSCVGFPSETFITKTRTTDYFPGVGCCVVQEFPFRIDLRCQHTIFDGCPGSSPVVDQYSAIGQVVDQVQYGVCVNSLAGCNSVRCCCGSQCKMSPGLNCDSIDDVNCIEMPGVNSWLSGSAAVLYECSPCLNPLPAGCPGPFPQCKYVCSEALCGGSGCCLCDRFCAMDAATCASKGGQPAASAAACKAANVKPACRKGFWKRGKRPTNHTPVNRLFTRGMALFSKQKTKDLSPASDECKTQYAWMQRHATRSMMHGAICNQFNKACPNTRTARKLKLVRHPTKGMMRFEGKYRKPCPESADMGCTTTVGCP